MLFYYWTDENGQFFWSGKEWVGTLSLAKFYTDEQEAWEDEHSIGGTAYIGKGTVNDLIEKEREMLCKYGMVGGKECTH